MNSIRKEPLHRWYQMNVIFHSPLRISPNMLDLYTAADSLLELHSFRSAVGMRG